MLVNFRVENFKSFKDLTEFSMEATKLKNLKESNTFEVNNISLLKSAVVYGANASGKSNLLDAMKKMKKIILNSVNMQKMKEYPHEPFLLNDESEKKPTIYEIEFVVENILYRYGFEINKDAIILEEWLYQRKLESRAKEVKLFHRIRQEISIGIRFKEGKNLKEKTRDNALFLSIVAQFNGEISLKVLDWFSYLGILSSLESNDFKFLSFTALDNSNYKEKIVNLIKSSDVGIYDLTTKKVSVDEFLNMHKGHEELDNQMLKNLIEESFGQKIDEEEETRKVQTVHMQYDKNNKFKEFKSFDLTFESEGTQRLLALAAPLILALEKGGILVIDELDNSLHTDLVNAIIKLFNSRETNPNNAQLIFTTHDTNLLDQELFRRDQIWFAQKDIYGASEIYSLVEYRKTRDDMALEKNYLDGKFGAKPQMGLFSIEVA